MASHILHDYFAKCLLLRPILLIILEGKTKIVYILLHTKDKKYYGYYVVHLCCLFGLSLTYVTYNPIEHTGIIVYELFLVMV